MPKDLVLRSTLLAKSTTPNTRVGRVAERHMRKMAHIATLTNEAIENQAAVVREAQIKGMMAVCDAEFLRLAASRAGISPEAQFAYQRLTTEFLYELGDIVRQNSDQILHELALAGSTTEPDGLIEWLRGLARRAIG